MYGGSGVLCFFLRQIRHAPLCSQLCFKIVPLPSWEGDIITLFPLHYSNQTQARFIKKDNLTTTKIPHTRLFYIHFQWQKWWLLRDPDRWKAKPHKRDRNNICLVTLNTTQLLLLEPFSFFSVIIFLNFQVNINITIVSLTYLYMLDISNRMVTFKMY